MNSTSADSEGDFKVQKGSSAMVDGRRVERRRKLVWGRWEGLI